MFVWTFHGVVEAIWLGLLVTIGAVWGIAHLISRVRNWWCEDETKSNRR